MLHGGPGAPGCVASLCHAMREWARVREPLQRRAGPIPLNVAQHVRDLADVAPSNAILIGHSWGAMLGLSYAAAHPANVRALILIGCGTYDHATRQLYVDRMNHRLGPEGRANKHALKQALNAADDPTTRTRVFTELAALSVAAQSVDALPDDGLDTALPLDPTGHAETWADVVERQRTGTDPASFSAIRCPVTMLHGADDPHPGPETATLLRHYLPTLRYTEFPNCGHEPWREQAARTDFLTELRTTVSEAAEQPPPQR